MKKILILAILSAICSCSVPLYKQEAAKSAKAGAASQRINSSQENSREVFKDLD